MGGPRHDAQALARFQRGESRLVFARYREMPNAAPFYLEDGTAAAHREFTRQHLECFMPECDQRRLKTVSRSSARDGFSHFSGAGGHAPERLFHQQAKALIVRWVHRVYPHVTAVAEQPSPSGDRIADVMLTWPDGQRLAVEVQYADQPVAKWEERTESYWSQGINVAWLLGHTPPHLRMTPGGAQVRLGAAHKWLTSRDMPVIWINPVEATVGTTWCARSIHACQDWQCPCGHKNLTFPMSPSPADTYGSFAADPIDTCTLTPRGVTSPTLNSVVESTFKAHTRAAEVEHLVENHRREQVRLAALAAAAAADAQRRARELAAQAEQERLARLSVHRKRAGLAWSASTLRATLLERHDGTLPALITDRDERDRAMIAHPEHWRAALYSGLIMDQPYGGTFTLATALGVLQGQHLAAASREPGAPTVKEAVGAFLDRMAAAGLVTVRRSRLLANVPLTVTVIGDLHTAAQRSEAEASRRSAQQQAALEIRAEEEVEFHAQRAKEAMQRQADTRENGFGPAPLSAVQTAPTSAEGGSRYTHCIVCGQRLAEEWARVGRHLLC